MEYEMDPDWRDDFLLTSRTATTHERVTLARSAASGDLDRIARGAYLPASMRASRSVRHRHRDLVGARELLATSEWIFSHASAASLWRLPRIGAWPTIVDLVADRASGGRSTPGIRRHAEGSLSDPDTIDGIRVTPLVRTVIDLARSESWENAVVAADAALARRRFGGVAIHLERDSLVAELEGSSPRGTAVARRVIDFASQESGSPGESLSRIAIARHGMTRPILQQRFDDEFGAMYVDFFWPDFGVIGEFDGAGKYLREQWTDGRTAAQVVVDEKWREDRLRRMGPRVVRWGWDLARRPVGLVKLLRSVGVR